MDNKVSYFDNNIAMALRNDGMQEPLVKWYRELFIKHDKTSSQLTLFRVIQSIGVIKAYPELYEELMLLDEIERGFSIAKATALKLSGAKDITLIEKFGSVEKSRVVYAAGILSNNKETLEWFNNLDEEERTHLLVLAYETANKLRK